jgi:DAK2 domain fusion protein YloV
VPDVLDASAARRWCSASLDALTAARRRIDDLNVFPVADGDTGTNLGQTLGAAAAQLRAVESADPAALLAAMADGAARGARGNSGVILAHLLGGLAGSALAVPGRPLGAAVFARGLAQGAEAARAALAAPVEGTILSVATAAADAAAAAATGDDGLAAAARAAADAAAAALQETPHQLAVLGEAGVVDAGGLGLVLILDALVGVLTNEVVLRYGGAAAPQLARSAELADATRHERPRETGSEEFGYEVQYLLEAPAERVEALRGSLGELGDSLAVVPIGQAGSTQWNVHIHVNDVGAAIEAGLAAGSTSQISVTRFADQMADRLAGNPDTGPGAPRVAVVAVAPGAGLGYLFAGEGVAVAELPEAPPSARRTAGSGTARQRDWDSALRELRVEVVKAVLATRAAGVILLTSAATAAVAEAAAVETRAQGRDVAVIAVRSPVQGLAALAVHDPARQFADDVAAMAEAAGATRCAEVLIAAAPMRTAQGVCAAGDAVGLIEGDPVAHGDDVIGVAAALLMRILSVGGELVTVLPGVGVEPSSIQRLVVALGDQAPGVEVSVLPGGQQSPPLLLGIE